MQTRSKADKAADATLADANAHAFDKDIAFEPKTHTYRVAGRASPTSVTKIVSRAFPAFNPDETIDRILDSAKYRNGESEYTGMSRTQIKEKWRRNGESARNLGTALHARIEDHLNGVVREDDDRDYAQFLEFMRGADHLVPYRTEWKVFSEKSNVAGTIDAVFYNTRTQRYDVYDWKRCKEISRNGFDRYAIADELREFEVPDANYYKYSLQLCVYRAILEERYGLEIGEAVLVRMDGGDGAPEVIVGRSMMDEARALLVRN
jgi:ATP-dependent exoDNAse (exonuclease V) beta subunit